MKIILEDEDIVKLVYNAFVDGGLHELGYADIEIKFSDEQYKETSAILKEQLTKQEVKTVYDGVCYEDVLVQLFKEEKLYFHDHGERKKLMFTPASVRKNLDDVLGDNKFKMDLFERIIESLDEKNSTADALTHFCILQYMLYKEIIYG
jgi:hypothetical protein